MVRLALDMAHHISMNSLKYADEEEQIIATIEREFVPNQHFSKQFR